jgi:hypothetical protein
MVTFIQNNEIGLKGKMIGISFDLIIKRKHLNRDSVAIQLCVRNSVNEICEVNS